MASARHCQDCLPSTRPQRSSYSTACPSEAYQRLQSARKNHPHSTQRSLPNGPKGPRRGPLGPFPRGPWGPWARRVLLLSSKRRGDITTERHCNRTAVRRSEFIGSAGMRASVKNHPKVTPKSSQIDPKIIPKPSQMLYYDLLCYTLLYYVILC